MAQFKKVLYLVCGLGFFIGILRAENLGNKGKAQNLKKEIFEVCHKKIKLEVAKTFQERQLGLMHREGVERGGGMLFVFESAQVLNFWMKNVPFDIDIGFFDSRGKFLRSWTMLGTSPLTKDEALPLYSSEQEALYAVEVEKGFFKNQMDQSRTCTLRPLLKTF